MTTHSRRCRCPRSVATNIAAPRSSHSAATRSRRPASAPTFTISSGTRGKVSSPIVELALAGWSVCVVHGNGPQVGDELVRNEVAREEASPLPLGVLVAATAGWIGYMIQQSFENALRKANSPRRVATIITQVQVDPNDPSLRSPTKFIGQALSPERVAELEAKGTWSRSTAMEIIDASSAARCRSRIRELPIIRLLVREAFSSSRPAAGERPSTSDPSLGWEGIDAVVDKDLVAAVLARDLGAQLLLILTDVDAVYADWGTPNQRPLRRLTAAEAEHMDAQRAFGEGSMAPKIRAAIDFVRRTDGRAVITSLAQGRLAVRGRAGTTITNTSATAESV